MTFTYLRLEAVNLAHSIFDTEDLSTRRGGSYMLLQAIRDVKKHFPTLEAISTGASAGLFKVREGNAEQLKEEVFTFLYDQKKRYQHATFVIDTVQEPDFKKAVEILIAKNRWQQMQTMSFSTCWAAPEDKRPSAEKPICNIDELRPAVKQVHGKNDNKQSVSASTLARRYFGIDIRQRFYPLELKTLKTHDVPLISIEKQGKYPRFTNDTHDLSQLSTLKNAKRHNISGNLDGKIAVFYADGNSFGSIQARCKTDTDLQAWDKHLRTQRALFLNQLLEHAQKHAHWQTSDGKLRLETLLWGGDEVMFIVPAWAGLELAKRFFDVTATKDWTFKGTTLSHAVGMVFAHHKAPISQLQKLAKDLADKGKEHHKNENSLTWVVMESFDHIGSEINHYWEHYGLTQGNEDWKKILLTPSKLKALMDMAELKNLLPRSAIVRALRYFADKQAFEDAEHTHPLVKRSYNSVKSALHNASRSENTSYSQRFYTFWQTMQCLPSTEQKSEIGVWDSTPSLSDIPIWITLLELWDYLIDSRNAAIPLAFEAPTQAGAML